LITVEDSNQPTGQYAYLQVKSKSIVLSISKVQTSNY